MKMASFLSSPVLTRRLIPCGAPTSILCRRREASTWIIAMAAASEEDGVASSSNKSTKLVTFLGKGGSGKTTSAVFAAQVSNFYAFYSLYV